MSQTKAVVLARAELHGDILLTNEAPMTLNLKAGDEFQGKVLFNYSEESSKKDDFRIELRSNLAGFEAEPVIHSHTDRRGLSDDQQGFVMQRYPDLAPGDHLLTFVVRVDFNDGGERHESTMDGQVLIIVD